MIRKLFYIVCIAVAVLFTGCAGGGSNGNFDVPDSLLVEEDEPLEVDSETKDAIVENIASPVEMAALIKSMGVPYSKKYLASTDNLDEFVTSQSKAFNLGVYGADLGYINMYNKQGSVIEYITAIKKLADGINVGQFFDFSTLKRLASNSQNMDSMMYISVHSFNKMDGYLSKNKRGNLSALMISGVWVEGLFLGTQVVKDNPSEKLAQTIGEQKTILNQLLLLLDIYKSDKYVADLIKELKKVKRVFDDIKITIEMGEPESVIKDGKLTIIQNEKSIVHMSEEQLNTIINLSVEVRANLINLK